MLRKYGISCIVAVSFANPLLANGLPEAANSSNCWVDAGTRYQVDPWLLYAIAEQERSLNPLAVNHNNRDKSRDVGIMQINSFWFPKLEKYGLSEQSLFDPCTNIHVGAWILSQSIQVFGNNWRAVGAYNAGTGKNETRENLRQKYAERVYQRYLRLVSGGMHKPAEP